MTPQTGNIPYTGYLAKLEIYDVYVPPDRMNLKTGDSGDARVNCSINEFRIYDSALTHEEVAQDYGDGPDVIGSVLVHRYSIRIETVKFPSPLSDCQALAGATVKQSVSKTVDKNQFHPIICFIIILHFLQFA